jgi:hypothetical protein
VLWVSSLVLGDARIHELAKDVGRVTPKNLGADTAMERVADLGLRHRCVRDYHGLWPATAYGSGLKRAFDRLMTGKDERAKGLRGRGLTLLALLPLFILGSLAGGFAAGKALGSSTASRILGAVAALAISFVVAATALVLIYRIFPPRHLRWGPSAGRRGGGRRDLGPDARLRPLRRLGGEPPGALREQRAGRRDPSRRLVVLLERHDARRLQAGSRDERRLLKA